jgi:hypothetical protein
LFLPFVFLGPSNKHINRFARPPATTHSPKRPLNDNKLSGTRQNIPGMAFSRSSVIELVGIEERTPVEGSGVTAMKRNFSNV